MSAASTRLDGNTSSPNGLIAQTNETVPLNVQMSNQVGNGASTSGGPFSAGNDVGIGALDPLNQQNNAMNNDGTQSSPLLANP